MRVAVGLAGLPQVVGRHEGRAGRGCPGPPRSIVAVCAGSWANVEGPVGQDGKKETDLDVCSVQFWVVQVRTPRLLLLWHYPGLCQVSGCC